MNREEELEAAKRGAQKDYRVDDEDTRAFRRVANREARARDRAFRKSIREFRKKEDPRSFLEHWKRGIFSYFFVALTVLPAVVVSALVVGVTFIILELLLPNRLGAVLEDYYMPGAVIVVTIILAPYTLSTGWESMKEIIDSFSPTPQSSPEGLISPKVEPPS